MSIVQKISDELISDEGDSVLKTFKRVALVATGVWLGRTLPIPHSVPALVAEVVLVTAAVEIGSALSRKSNFRPVGWALDRLRGILNPESNYG